MIPKRIAIPCAVMVVVLTCPAGASQTGKTPITTSSQEALSYYLKGRDLGEKLRGQESISLFKKAIDRDKNFAMAYYNLSLVSPTAKEFFANLKKGVELSSKVSRAEQLIIRGFEAGVNGRPEQQREYYQELVRNYPEDERAHFLLAGYYFAQQDYEKAVDEYLVSTRIAPEFSQPYNQLGYAYRFLNHFDKAEDAFKTYITLIPNDPNPYDSYAELLLKAGRFDESVQEYRKALALDEHFQPSRFGIAANLMYENKHDAALKELGIASGLSRNDGERRAVLATTTIVNMDRGDVEAALRAVQAQYDIGKNINDPAAMAGDLVTMGTILVEQSKVDEAIEKYRQAGAIMASSSLGDAVKANARLFQHYNVGMAYARRGDLEKAMQEAAMFQKGAEANQNLFQERFAHEMFGVIALAKKQYAQAIAELSKANSLNPYNLYRLALAYQGQGKKEQAAEYCRQAARFNSIPNINYAFVRTMAQQMLATL